MREFVVFLIAGLFICVPCPLRAQSTLNFSRIMGVADMPVTGYAVVNPGSAPATVTFTLYGSDGIVVGAPSMWTIAAGGQLAKLGSELFPTATSGGWTQATSSASGLRGFWLGGDFVTYADSAAAVTSAMEFIFPIITTQSEIDLINPDSSNEYALIQLYDSDGQVVSGAQVEPLPAMGAYRQNASALFDPSDLSVATTARVTCMMSCAGSVLVRDYLAAPSLAVTNGVSTASTTTNLNFPHVVQGLLTGLNYSTVLSVTNLAANEQTVTITYTPQSGALPTSVPMDLDANGTFSGTLSTLFGLNGGSFYSGWINVSSQQPVAGIAIYAELVNAGVAVTSGQSQTSSNLILAHIADLPPWWTGVALVNPGVTTATVNVYAIAPDGTLIGKSAPFSIQPGAKVASLLSEWIPQTQKRSGDGGFIFVQSNLPLYGMELFFTRDLQILSNVPAFDLSPTEHFIPPPPNR